MKRLTRVRAFLRRHKHAEEVAAEAVGLNLLWTVLRLAGVFGAGVAAAAIVSSTTSQSTYHPAFSLSTKGAAFVARYEGLRTRPYNDPFNCTVGVGHLIHMGPCSSGDYARWTITTGQAMTMLIHDAATAQGYVRSSVTHRITQPQFDALVDFTFNVGGGALQRSSVLRYVNAGSFSGVPARLTVYSYASGHYLSGLHTRRVAEGVLFTRGYYGSGIGAYTPPKPLTAADRLRARTGYYSWLAWYLGEGAWKKYAPAAAKVRPNVPRRVPPLWWRRERAFLRARSV